MRTTALDLMDFREFRAFRERLAADSSLADMAEHNLYASLPAAFPGRFDPMGESRSSRAPYRCHVAELFLERWGMGPEAKTRTSVCEGVRAALSAVFRLAASRGMRLMVPSDVYPEYLALARAARVDFSCYQALLGPPGDEKLAAFDGLLVCEPTKPWGVAMPLAEAARLGSWAAARPESRLLIADCAYDIDGTPAARLWRGDRSALILASLSKGWLAPRRAGCAFAPDGWVAPLREALGALPKSESGLRQAYRALADFPGRPADVASALATLAPRADATLGALGRLPWSGYFAHSPLPASDWLAKGIIAIPASAFGSSSGHSILSLLPPA